MEALEQCTASEGGKQTIGNAVSISSGGAPVFLVAEDWYPWDADPFKRAKELHRPILLDVGAVWCPWCALMDRDAYTTASMLADTSLPHGSDVDLSIVGTLSERFRQVVAFPL